MPQDGKKPFTDAELRADILNQSNQNQKTKVPKEFFDQIQKDQNIKNERMLIDYLGDLGGDVQSSAQGFLDMRTFGLYTMTGLPKPVDVLKYMGQLKGDMGAIGYRPVEDEDRVDMELFGQSLNELLYLKPGETLKPMKGLFDADRREGKTIIGKMTDTIAFLGGFKPSMQSAAKIQSGVVSGGQKLAGVKVTTTAGSRARLTKGINEIAEKYGIDALKGVNIPASTRLALFRQNATEQLITPISRMANPSIFKSGKAIDKFAKTHYNEAAKLLDETLAANGIKIGRRMARPDGRGFYNPAIDDIMRLVQKEHKILGGRPITSLADGIAKTLGDRKVAVFAAKIFDEAANFALANAILQTPQELGYMLGTKSHPGHMVEGETIRARYGETMEHGFKLGATLGVIKLIPGGAKSGMQLNPLNAEGRANISMMLGRIPEALNKYKIKGSGEAAVQGRESIWTMFNYYSKMNQPGVKTIISDVFNANQALVKAGGLKGGSGLASITRALGKARKAKDLKAEEALSRLMQKSMQAIGKDVRKNWRPLIKDLIKQDVTDAGTWFRMIAGGVALGGGFEQLRAPYITPEDKVVAFLTGAFLMKRPHSYAYRGNSKFGFGTPKKTDGWNIHRGWKESYGEAEVQAKSQREIVEALGYEPYSEYFISKMAKQKYDEPFLDIHKRLQYQDTNPDYVDLKSFFYKEGKDGKPLFLKPKDQAEGLVQESFPQGKDKFQLDMWDAYKNMLENDAFFANEGVRMLGKGEFTVEAWKEFVQYNKSRGIQNPNEVIMKIGQATKPQLNQVLKADLIDGVQAVALQLKDLEGNSIGKIEEVLSPDGKTKVLFARRIIYGEKLGPEEKLMIEQFNSLIDGLSDLYPDKIQVDTAKAPITINANVKGQATFFEGMKDLILRSNEALGFKESDNITIDFTQPYLWEEMLYAKTAQDIPEIISFLKEVREYKVDDLGTQKAEVQVTQNLLSKMFTDGNNKIVTDITSKSLKNVPKEYHDFVRDLLQLYRIEGDPGIKANKFIDDGTAFTKNIELKDVRALYDIFAKEGWATHFKGKIRNNNNELIDNYVVEEIIAQTIKQSRVDSYVGEPTTETTASGEIIHEIRPYGEKEFRQDEQLRDMGIIEPGTNIIVRPLAVLKEAFSRVDMLGADKWELVIKELGTGHSDTQMAIQLLKAAQEYRPDVIPSDYIKMIHDLLPPSQHTVKYRDMNGKIGNIVVGQYTDSKTATILTESGAKELIIKLDMLANGIYKEKQLNFQQSFQRDIVQQELKGLGKTKQNLVKALIQSNLNGEGALFQYQLEALGYVSQETGKFFPEKLRNIPQFQKDVAKILKGVNLRSDTIESLIKARDRLEDLDQETPNVERTDDIAKSLGDVVNKYQFSGDWIPIPGKNGGVKIDPIVGFEKKIRIKIDLGEPIEKVVLDIADNIKENNKFDKDGIERKDYSEEDVLIEMGRIINTWDTGTKVHRINIDLGNGRAHSRQSLVGIKNKFIDNYSKLTSEGTVQNQLVFFESSIVGYGNKTQVSLNQKGMFERIAAEAQAENGILTLDVNPKSSESELDSQIKLDDIMMRRRYILYRPDKASYALGVPMEPKVLDKIAQKYVKYRRDNNLSDGVGDKNMPITEILGEIKWDFTFGEKDPMANVKAMSKILNDILMSETWGNETWLKAKEAKGEDAIEVIKRLKLARNRSGLPQSKEKDLQIANMLKLSKVIIGNKKHTTKLIKTFSEDFDSVVVNDERILADGTKDVDNPINKLMSVSDSRGRTAREEFKNLDESELSSDEQRVLDQLKEGRNETSLNSISIVNPDLVESIAFKMGIRYQDLNKIGGLKYIMLRYDSKGNLEPVKTAGGVIPEFADYFKAQKGKNRIGFIEFTSGNKKIGDSYNKSLTSKIFEIDSYDQLKDIPSQNRIPHLPENMSLLSVKSDKPSKLAPNLTSYFRSVDALKDYNNYNITRKYDTLGEINNSIFGENSTQMSRIENYKKMLQEKYNDRSGEFDFNTTNNGTMYHLSKTRHGIDPYFNIDSYIDMVYANQSKKVREIDHGYESVLLPDVSNTPGVELRNSIVDKKGVITIGQMRESWMNGEQMIDKDNFFINIHIPGKIDKPIHVKAIPDYIKKNKNISSTLKDNLEILSNVGEMKRVQLFKLITAMKQGKNNQIELAGLVYRNPVVGPNSVLIEAVKGFTDKSQVGSNVHIINKADIVRELEADHDIDTAITINAQPRGVFNEFRGIRPWVRDAKKWDMDNPSFNGMNLKNYEAIQRFVEDVNTSDLLKAVPMTLPRLLQFARFYDSSSGYLNSSGKEFSGVVIHSGKNRFITIKEGGWDTDSLLKTLNQHFLDAEGKGHDKTFKTKQDIWETVLFGKDSPFDIRIVGKNGKTLDKIPGATFKPLDMHFISQYLEVHERFLSNIKYDWSSGKMSNAKVKDIVRATNNYYRELSNLEHDAFNSLGPNQRKEFLALRTGKAKSGDREEPTIYNGANINASINKTNAENIPKGKMLPAEMESLHIKAMYDKQITVSKSHYSRDMLDIDSKLLDTTIKTTDAIKEFKKEFTQAMHYTEAIQSLYRRKDDIMERLANEYNLSPKQLYTKNKKLKEIKYEAGANLEGEYMLKSQLGRLDKTIDSLESELDGYFSFKKTEKGELKTDKQGKPVPDKFLKLYIDEIKSAVKKEIAIKAEKEGKDYTNKELNKMAMDQLIKQGGIKINNVVTKDSRVSQDYISERAGSLTWGEIGKYSYEKITSKVDVNQIDKEINKTKKEIDKIINSVFTGEGVIAKRDWNRYDAFIQREIDMLLQKANGNFAIENIMIAKLASHKVATGEYDLFRGQLFPTVEGNYSNMKINAILKWNNTKRMLSNPAGARKFNEILAQNINASTEFILNGGSDSARAAMNTGIKNVWSTSDLFKNTNYSRENFLGEINPLTQALYGRNWGRLSTWQKLQFYYGQGIHEYLLRADGLPKTIHSAYNTRKKFNTDIDTLRDLEIAIEDGLHMFYSGDVKPNEFTSMIFNGNNFGPIGKQGRGYSGNVGEWARKLVANACKIKFGN